jgi:hypothetical protein
MSFNVINYLCRRFVQPEPVKAERLYFSPPVGSIVRYAGFDLVVHQVSVSCFGCVLSRSNGMPCELFKSGRYLVPQCVSTFRDDGCNICFKFKNEDNDGEI